MAPFNSKKKTREARVSHSLRKANSWFHQGSLFSVAMISATVLKATRPGAPRWLSRLGVRVLISAQVTSLWLVGSKPVSGSVLTTWSLLEILALSSLSLSLSAPLLLVLSLSQNREIHLEKIKN